MGELAAGDEVQKLSQRIGASTEALSEYRHVANLTGVTFRELAIGWQRQTRRIAEAAQGTGEAKNALRELNVSVKDLARLRPEQQFEVLADAISGVAEESDRVRLAQKLWDSEGVKLLQTVQAGSAGLREMREEARQLGPKLAGVPGVAEVQVVAEDGIAYLKVDNATLDRNALDEFSATRA